jgi:hypothetical protein
MYEYYIEDTNEGDASDMESEWSCYLLAIWSNSMNDLEMSTKMFIFMNVV